MLLKSEAGMLGTLCSDSDLSHDLYVCGRLGVSRTVLTSREAPSSNHLASHGMSKSDA